MSTEFDIDDMSDFEEGAEIIGIPHFALTDDDDGEIPSVKDNARRKILNLYRFISNRHDFIGLTSDDMQFLDNLAQDMPTIPVHELAFDNDEKMREYYNDSELNFKLSFMLYNTVEEEYAAGSDEETIKHNIDSGRISLWVKKVVDVYATSLADQDALLKEHERATVAELAASTAEPEATGTRDVGEHTRKKKRPYLSVHARVALAQQPAGERDSDEDSGGGGDAADAGADDEHKRVQILERLNDAGHALTNVEYNVVRFLSQFVSYDADNVYTGGYFSKIKPFLNVLFGITRLSELDEEDREEVDDAVMENYAEMLRASRTEFRDSLDPRHSVEEQTRALNRLLETLSLRGVTYTMLEDIFGAHEIYRPRKATAKELTDRLQKHFEGLTQEEKTDLKEFITERKQEAKFRDPASIARTSCIRSVDVPELASYSETSSLVSNVTDEAETACMVDVLTKQQKRRGQDAWSIHWKHDVHGRVQVSGPNLKTAAEVITLIRRLWNTIKERSSYGTERAMLSAFTHADFRFGSEYKLVNVNCPVFVYVLAGAVTATVKPRAPVELRSQQGTFMSAAGLGVVHSVFVEPTTPDALYVVLTCRERIPHATVKRARAPASAAESTGKRQRQPGDVREITAETEEEGEGDEDMPNAETESEDARDGETAGRAGVGVRVSAPIQASAREPATASMHTSTLPPTLTAAARARVPTSEPARATEAASAVVPAPERRAPGPPRAHTAAPAFPAARTHTLETRARTPAFAPELSAAAPGLQGVVQIPPVAAASTYGDLLPARHEDAVRSFLQLCSSRKQRPAWLRLQLIALDMNLSPPHSSEYGWTKKLICEAIGEKLGVDKETVRSHVYAVVPGDPDVEVTSLDTIDTVAVPALIDPVSRSLMTSRIAYGVSEKEHSLFAVSEEENIETHITKHPTSRDPIQLHTNKRGNPFEQMVNQLLIERIGVCYDPTTRAVGEFVITQHKEAAERAERERHEKALGIVRSMWRRIATQAAAAVSTVLDQFVEIVENTSTLDEEKQKMVKRVFIWGAKAMIACKEDEALRRGDALLHCIWKSKKVLDSLPVVDIAALANGQLNVALQSQLLACAMVRMDTDLPTTTSIPKLAKSAREIRDAWSLSKDECITSFVSSVHPTAPASQQQQQS